MVMKKKQDFFDFLRQGEIALTDYPLQGANILLPYGKGILNKIETIITSKLLNLGYKELLLPEIVPESFISHLKVEELFRTNSPFRSFYLAGSFEMQSAYSLRKLVGSYKDLPAKLFSVGNVRRENQTTSLIKDIECRSVEINAFFSNESDAVDEWKNLNHEMKKIFDRLNINNVWVKQKRLPSSPIVAYSHFPFSDTFGSIFWSCVVGTKYTQAVNAKFHTKDNSYAYPIQLNAGLTSRILSSYLSNNLDDDGFVIHPDFSPYFSIASSNFSYEMKSLLASFIAQRRTDICFVNTDRVPLIYKKFLAMGMPILITPGEHQIGLTVRFNRLKKWVDEGDLVDNIRKLLDNYPSLQQNRVSHKIIGENTELNEIKGSNIIYLVKQNEDTFRNLSHFKEIGYLLSEDNNEYACFVEKKY